MSFFRRAVSSFVKHTREFVETVVRQAKPLAVLLLATIGAAGRIVRVGVNPTLALGLSVCLIIGLVA